MKPDKLTMHVLCYATISLSFSLSVYHNYKISIKDYLVFILDYGGSSFKQLSRNKLRGLPLYICI